jgi:hypothetical protein
MLKAAPGQPSFGRNVHFAPSALFIQGCVTQGVALGYYMSRLWR